MTYRILTAEFMHETNTFSRIATDEQAFRDCYYLDSEEAVSRRGKLNTELAGFLDSGARYNWDIDHIHSAGAGPAGKVTSATFDWICDPIVAAASLNQYDGILLGLHGAMVTDFCEDGEGELLNRLRAVVGADLPIAITLDLHANVSEAMCDLADIIVSYKTYPHIDMRTAGRQAGELLQRTLNSEIHPRTIRVSRPMLEEVNGGRSDIGPMVNWIEAARERELRADTFAVSINGGFASADIASVGPTVLVTAEGDMDAHRAFAQSIADEIWGHRNDVLNDYLEVDQAAKIAQRFDSARGPLVIADYADNPGAGAYGDSTNLLQALLEAGVSDACFGPIVDPETALLLHQQEVGGRVDIQLGAKVDSSMGGEPLSLRVELIHKSDGCYIGGGAMIGGLQRSFGATAVVRVDGIEILVTSLAQQLLDLQQFKSFGINPETKRVVALKSMQHFRADFEPIAGRVIVCDGGAMCTPRYELHDYRNVPRPIFPLDRDFEN
jgi:microcystin degradation protein MlrC